MKLHDCVVIFLYFWRQELCYNDKKFDFWLILNRQEKDMK